MKKPKSSLTAIIFVSLYFSFGTLHCIAQLTTLLNFNGTNGSTPTCLINDGTFLYGTTNGGCAYGKGIIYKIKLDGTGFDTIFNFNCTTGCGATSLISVGTFLYGTTIDGGSAFGGNGTIFKIKPDGTEFDTLMSFNVINGSNPTSLISDGTYLYGTTNYGGGNGGLNNHGNIYKIKLDGTGFDTLMTFIGETRGSSPQSSIISDGTYLYGTTSAGGAYGYGTIYKIKPDGTGFNTIFNFNGTNGSGPMGSFISDGTYFYGITNGSGANATIFKIKPDGTGFNTLMSFGSNSPVGSLISIGTYLYGTTSYDGAYGLGTIYKIKSDGTGFDTLMSFNGNNGSTPTSLISDSAYLYGTTVNGGVYDSGTVFKYRYCTTICPPPTTSIAENILESNVNIYPNPTSGLFNLVLGQLENVQITIYDLLGKGVYQNNNTSSNHQVDLSNQPNGVYFISIKTNEGTVFRKILISQ